MLGAQSVPRSMDTSAETTAPLADCSIHDQRAHQRAYLSIRSSFKIVDASYS